MAEKTLADTTMPLALDEILNGSRGRIYNAEAAGKTRFSAFISDSRQAAPGCIFLCIKGERVDGHDFIDQVAGKGAALIIGDNADKIAKASSSHPNTSFLAVEDSLKAVQAIATAYRRHFHIPVIGLTGSSGKTTTKDLMSSIFNAAFVPALVTEGTLNNHWGVPQMALRLRPSHKAAVFEMGTSGFGEIQNLTAISQPCIGFITIVGESHLETLIDKNGVAKAKRELFDWIVAHGDAGKHERILFFNIDDPLLANLYVEFKAARPKRTQLITVSLKDKKAKVHLVHKAPLGVEDNFGWSYEFATPWGAVSGVLPLPGAHNLGNALAAAALALATGAVLPTDVARGLTKPVISKLRSELFKLKNGAVVYNDSYNANPSSVTALLAAAHEIKAIGAGGIKRLVAVVGDMLELGPESGELHRKMGAQAAHDGVEALLATGNFAPDWIHGFDAEKGAGQRPAQGFLAQDQLWNALCDDLHENAKGTLLLVKGSRGAKMDQIVERLRALA